MHDKLMRTLYFLCRLFCAAAVVLGSLVITAGSKAAPSTLVVKDKFVYLPYLRLPDPLAPWLISPYDDEQLNTLIPQMQWDSNKQPAGTTGCLALDKNPNPTACWLYFDPNYTKKHLPWGNLDPSTVYSWRVGMEYNNDPNSIKWSDEFMYTTGPVGGKILPAPTLKSPSNNALIPPSKMLFTWTPVTGAVEYMVWIISDTESMSRGYLTTTAQLDLRYDMGTYKANTPYRWYVQVRNNYAWSKGSTIWNFKLNASMAPGLSSSGIQPTFIHRGPFNGDILHPAGVDCTGPCP